MLKTFARKSNLTIGRLIEKDCTRRATLRAARSNESMGRRARLSGTLAQNDKVMALLTVELDACFTLDYYFRKWTTSIAVTALKDKQLIMDN